jgi:SpoVK/Ycf46/Vps4 family AAA+-type ATPase
VDVAKPTQAEQTQAWQSQLEQHISGVDAAALADRLANQFSFNLSDIRRVAGSASPDVQPDQRGPAERLWQACLMAARPRLDMLAQRLEVSARVWEDLVLPAPEAKILRQIVDQVSQRQRVYQQWGFDRRLSRGLGINALFAGESGTGKTLAAEVIASELQLNLYRIDLSQVVSKYIGETEKNLRKLFDAAEDGGTILFFDEADALFGKRSEVKDSHDRYANIEINYLLQRMEAYRGLAILATNVKSALDPAFMRRLRFIVSFPFPGITERARIWQRAFPEEAEQEALDYDGLARFNLTGGSIQNIAINAAFLAASAGGPISMPLILDAARGEFRKLEKPFNEADFRLVPAEARA